MTNPTALAASPTELPLPAKAAASARPSLAALGRCLANSSVRIGGAVLLLLVALAIFAPYLGTIDPNAFDAGNRDLLPLQVGNITTLDGDVIAHRFLMGADALGRDIYSRVLFGIHVSLLVGFACAAISLAMGTLLGLLAGYFRWLDQLIMRIMDGLMAIPGILVAIALVSLWSASLSTIVLAVAIPEIPRVTRLVRSLILSLREEPYVEAAISLGARPFQVIFKHLLPNTVAPLIVQGTYICASAMLTEAVLSFLGVGLPSEIPTWGNVMADGRAQFQDFPHEVLFAGVFLALSVLAINILGDGLRDCLDAKRATRT